MNSEFHTVRGYELIKVQSESLTSALEDYLEMIYRNSLTEPYIRVKELARLLNVNDSSASKMVKRLGELELVDYEKYGIIKLTPEGENLGKLLLNRHLIIEEFLCLLGLSSIALDQTELMEHIVQEETLKEIETLNQFFVKHDMIYQTYLQFKEPKKWECSEMTKNLSHGVTLLFFLLIKILIFTFTGT